MQRLPTLQLCPAHQETRTWQPEAPLGPNENSTGQSVQGRGGLAGTLPERGEERPGAVVVGCGDGDWIWARAQRSRLLLAVGAPSSADRIRPEEEEHGEASPLPPCLLDELLRYAATGFDLP